MIRARKAVSCLMAAFLLTAAGEPPAAPSAASDGGGIVARRGDLQITRAELEETLGMLDPAARAQVTATQQSLAAFTRDRLLNLAVLAEAKTNGWDAKPDIVKRIAETRDAVIVQTWLNSKVTPDPMFPSEADITTAYENNKAHLLAPKQYHVAQIVLLVKHGATAQEDEAVRKQAVDLRAQAVRPKGDFADLAKKNSQEQASAAKGGDVGWLREPDMLQPAREAVATLADSGVSQPVRMPDGWHILKLLEMRPAGQIPLMDAKPQIVQALRQARTQQVIRAYLDNLAKTQPIEVNEIELTKEVGTGK